SPPETPMPTKLTPVARTAFSRRMVSVNSALPPSTMMSPGSNTASRSSITASVGAPAFTMTIAVRGLRSAAANSAYDPVGTKPASGCSATSSSVLARVRLNTATVLPSRLARLRARFEPITASPTTPMFAAGSVMVHSSYRDAPWGGDRSSLGSDVVADVMADPCRGGGGDLGDRRCDVDGHAGLIGLERLEHRELG